MRRFFDGGYDQDVNMDGGFDDDNFSWGNNSGGPMPINNKRPRYGDAYGDYRGGYGPGGGYGPRPLMPPGPPRMPPPLMGPMRPFGPPGPPGFPRGNMWGRQFGPKGQTRKHPADDKAIKYLMRCGVTKEHLKNLPHDLLQLILPERCGLCDVIFDSFTISRVHYISKNHLKNQKKWLSKTQGMMAPNEVPFKSRDLYCELCDIQITSKQHGDAHYEGKPHRGIVEGRKKPKNPLLLQSNMQARLDQLIRREKRCLKPAKDAAPEGDEADVKDVKTTSPELYCDICKTTVTCSEQMTMHLNGKKHLSKEKHHILSMMRGKANNNDGVNREENEAENEGEGEEEDLLEGENKEAAGDDDWGNEAWESQDQPGTAAQA